MTRMLLNFFFVTSTKKNFRKGIKVFLSYNFCSFVYLLFFFLGLFFHLRSTKGIRKQQKLVFQQYWTRNHSLTSHFRSFWLWCPMWNKWKNNKKHFERKTRFFSHWRKETGMKVEIRKNKNFVWNFRDWRCRFLHQNAKKFGEIRYTTNW